MPQMPIIQPNRQNLGPEALGQGLSAGIGNYMKGVYMKREMEYRDKMLQEAKKERVDEKLVLFYNMLQKDPRAAKSFASVAFDGTEHDPKDLGDIADMYAKNPTVGTIILDSLVDKGEELKETVNKLKGAAPNMSMDDAAKIQTFINKAETETRAKVKHEKEMAAGKESRELAGAREERSLQEQQWKEETRDTALLEARAKDQVAELKNIMYTADLDTPEYKDALKRLRDIKVSGDPLMMAALNDSLRREEAMRKELVAADTRGEKAQIGERQYSEKKIDERIKTLTATRTSTQDKLGKFREGKTQYDYDILTAQIQSLTLFATTQDMAALRKPFDTLISDHTRLINAGAGTDEEKQKDVATMEARVHKSFNDLMNENYVVGKKAYGR